VGAQSPAERDRRAEHDHRGGRDHRRSTITGAAAITGGARSPAAAATKRVAATCEGAMDRDDVDGAREDAGSLEAMPWRLVAVAPPDSGPVEVAPEVESTATFADGRIQGSTGCNRYVGSAEIDGSALLVRRVASTRRACPPPFDEVERDVLAAFDRVRSYRLVPGGLELLAGDGAVLLRYVPRSLVPLIGTSWTAGAVNNGRQAVVSVLAGTVITMLLTPEGEASGAGGCNRWACRYELDGDRLRFGAVATTLMACTDPVMEQETAFHAALARVARWSIDGDRLQLRSEDGALQLDLAAEGEPSA
jgi:heat shock protein HslJ